MVPIFPIVFWTCFGSSRFSNSTEYIRPPCVSWFEGASGDSMDTIEREYVLVTAPVISTDNLAMSSRDSDFSGQHEGKRIHGSPQKVKNLNVGRRHTTGEVGSVASNGSAPLHSLQEVKVPSDHPPTRLPSLQRFARLITEVATDKVRFFCTFSCLNL